MIGSAAVAAMLLAASTLGTTTVVDELDCVSRNEVSGQSYHVACMLLPGRPDGWYDAHASGSVDSESRPGSWTSVAGYGGRVR